MADELKADPLVKGGMYMKLSMLGRIEIIATPTAANQEILSVDIIAENRTDPVSMVTNRDETTDQFCQRLRSMLRALYQAPVREHPTEATAVPAPARTFDEQKADIKAKRNAAARAILDDVKSI